MPCPYIRQAAADNWDGWARRILDCCVADSRSWRIRVGSLSGRRRRSRRCVGAVSCSQSHVRAGLRLSLLARRWQQRAARRSWSSSSSLFCRYYSIFSSKSEASVSRGSFFISLSNLCM